MREDAESVPEHRPTGARRMANTKIMGIHIGTNLKPEVWVKLMLAVRAGLISARLLARAGLRATDEV